VLHSRPEARILFGHGNASALKFTLRVFEVLVDLSLVVQVERNGAVDLSARKRRDVFADVGLFAGRVPERVLIPRENIEMILSSQPVKRVCPLLTIFGSKLPLRSRGVSREISPKSPFRIFFVLPLRKFPLW